MNEVVVTVASVCVVLTPIISWLLRHSTRLTAVEVRLVGMQSQLDLHILDVSAKLVRIESKLDRMIEREIARP